MRAKQRWNLEKARHPESIIADTFAASELIGDFIGDRGEILQILLEKRKQRALVYDPLSDTVVTVYSTKGSPLAPTLYDSVITLHKKQIGKLERRYKSIFKRYNSEREKLDDERRRIDEEIRRLKMERDHITAILDNYQIDLSRINSEKKSIIKSMAHYMSSPGNMDMEVESTIAEVN
ncbi:hypothetical protein N007_05565 [Alicyclobacillus acidoterrestris ATCC 49025]|nr:hypothetical protein N007_05565 [Alicyclobacillus acidoterrestris ATCC 49025]